MNFYSKDETLLKELSKLFNIPLNNNMKVNYSVSYSQNRRLSIVVIELSFTPIVHSLIFFYSRSLTLYDVLFYHQKRFQRLTNSSFRKYVDKINKKILRNLPRINKFHYSQIKEFDENNRKEELLNIEIDNLKNNLRLSKDTISNLRRQIKNLKSKNHIDRNS